MAHEIISSLKEQEYSISMAGFLATISTVAYSGLGLAENLPYIKICIFTAIGVLSIIGVALLCDYILDQAEIKDKERYFMLGGGYFIFASLSAVLLFGLLYQHGSFSIIKEYWAPAHLVVSVLASFSLFAKAMTEKADWPLWSMWSFVIIALSISVVSKCVG
ncbi:hypothetical protein Q4506_17205 [Colwellia sp. 4_MG-2023]|uniref:hypothetical protein n=1 Tax=unclassified Colwellia TaxID=196834 RepID=UPI0026E27D11|nr:MULTISPECIES: hypothetical protein [unclassified Colwellia]MDO6508750.1 hypothetical protein [Colwellia sp. 5_MG-2023]MDO6557415.1 hypothetical protein [Colwellia sp. 4_MG-2023]